MLKRTFALVLVLLMVASLGLTGCSKPAEPTGGGEGEEASGGGDVIKVGWMGSLTGDQAVWGQCEFDTVKMLVEETNAAGGLLGMQLEAVGYDTKGDAQEAVNVAKRLTGQDKVIAIIGPNASGNAIPIGPVCEEAKIADIATVATNPKVTLKEDGSVKPFNYRVCFIDPYQGAVAAGYAADVLGFTKAAILYDVADDYSQGLTEFFEEFFVKKGGTIVKKEAFKFGDVDFRPQLSKIKEAEPEVLFLPIFFKEASLIANQARELGIEAPLMGGDGLPSEQLFTMAKDAVQGTYIVNHVDYDDPDVADLKSRYSAKYGKEMELNGYLAHDAFILLKDAIERVGEADSEKVGKALESGDVVGVTGRIRISPETHNPIGKDAAIVKVEGDRYVFQQKYAAEE